jgi:signal transduction histidine kinase
VPTTAAPYQPPLTLWSHVWRSLVALVITAFAWWEIFDAQWADNRWLFWLDLAGGVVAYVLSFYRRRWPFAMAIAVSLIGFFSTASAGPATLVIVSMATRRRWREIIVVGLLSYAGAVVFALYQPMPTDNPFWIDLTFLAVVTAAILAIGMYIGSRRELLWTLRQRAETAESEQALRVTQARTNERARIAREMHDTLAHRISLITMHAGALAYRTDLTPDEVRASAEIIQAKAHEALVDLRQVLGVLRDDDGTVTDRPQPTYADVPALVTEAREAGMRVELEAADPAYVPEPVGRTVYRVVQEGLTNVRKHAPYAAARVTIAREDAGVVVSIWNPKSVGPSGTPGAGLGLVGLTERVELAGGRLHHHVDGQGFTLTAWLPVASVGG